VEYIHFCTIFSVIVSLLEYGSVLSADVKH